MKGINAFSAMSGVDDRFVMASLLPADLPGGEHATAKVRKQEKDNWFTRMTSSGWFAAAVSLVVAFGVLGGIVAAGRMGAGTPSGTHPSHGMQGNPSTQAAPVTDAPILIPPLSDVDGGSLSGRSITVTSDGQTVKLPGCTVFYSAMDENGGVEADGPGIASQLAEVAGDLPTLTTAGESFYLHLPEGMTLRQIRIYERFSSNGEIDMLELECALDPALPDLTELSDGTYYVVLGVYYESINSDTEWKKGLDEYGFCLVKDASWDQKAPVRVQAGLQTVYPIGYLLESTYYDAEKQEYVTKQYPGAILESLLFASSGYGLPGLTVDTQTVLNLFTADTYEVKSVKVYEFNGNELSLMKDDDNPFVAPIETDYGGGYVVVITANDGGTGEMHTLEFPFWLFVEDPNDGPAITEGPVEWGTGEIEPPTTTPAVKVHGSLRSAVFPTVRDGYRLWSEEWVDGSMASGMGLGAHGQLADILDEISAYNAVDGVRNPITVTLGNAGDTLIRVSVYDKELNHVTDGQDAPVLSELDAGTYIVVLTVVSVGDYIPEAEANERYCTEYAFVLELYAPEPEPPEPVTDAIP